MMLGKTNAVSGGKPVDMLQARVDATNSCAYLFYNYSGTELDINRLDTSNATSMESMFRDCSALTSLDLRSLKTSNVTNMNKMFEGCRGVVNFDLSNFDTSNVVDMSNMFTYCYSPSFTTLDLSSFNTSNVVDMSNMFFQCEKLTALDLSNFDTSKVTNMTYMFYLCINLTSLDLSNFDTSKVKGMVQMFVNCRHLTTIQGKLDLYSVTNNIDMFYNTYVLTGVTLKNIRKSLQIGSGTTYGHLWELPYLINAVKELWNYADSGTQYTLTIGSANLEKITNTYVKLITPTAEQIEADPYINNKLPCEVCESTDEGAMTLTAYAGLKNWVLA